MTKQNKRGIAGQLAEMMGLLLIVALAVYVLSVDDGGELLLLLLCMGVLVAPAAVLLAGLRARAQRDDDERYKPLWMLPGGLRCMLGLWAARRRRKKAEGEKKAESEKKAENEKKAEGEEKAEDEEKAESEKTAEGEEKAEAKKPGSSEPDGGKNNEVFTFDGPAFTAAGRRYRNVSELFAQRTDDPFFCYDRYGRRVLCLRDRFPCFDEFDALYENRFYRWSLVENCGTLTLVYTSDDKDEVRVVERVTVSQMEREPIDSFDRKLLRESPLSQLLIDDAKREDSLNGSDA